jgi:alpha-1,2-mannosyltransferase
VAVFLIVYLQARLSLFTTDRVIDSTSYYHAAKALALGLDPYDPQTLQRIAPPDSGPIYPYLYPPVLALAWRPLLAVTPARAHELFLVAGTLAAALNVALLLSVAPPPRHRGAWVIALVLFHAACGPLISTLRIGQINVLLATLVLASLHLLRSGRAGASGFFLALAILIKLTPAVYLLDLVFRRQWRALSACIVSLSGLVGATILFMGVDPWMSFATRAAKPLPFDPPMSPRGLVGSAMRAIGAPPAAIFWAFAVTVLLLGALVVRKQRRLARETGDPTPCWGACTFFGLLAFPLTWHHHYYLALLPFWYFLPRAVESGRRGPALLWVTCCLLTLLRYPALLHPLKPLASLAALLAM